MSLASTIVISPIPKEYPKHFNSMEKSLSEQGFVRTPGTYRRLSPKMEATGLYRTGLDKEAMYLKGLTKEEREIELDVIDELTKRIQSHYPGIDLSPSSKVWNVWGNSPVKASAVDLGNDNFYLELDKQPKDLLTYAWLRVSPGIARSREAIERGECPDCQYYIADEAIEQKSKFKHKIEQNKAISNLENLRDQPTKIIQIARLMGLPVTDSTNIERAYNLIDDKLKEGQFKTGEFAGKGVISVFNEICKLSDETMNVRNLIAKAIRHNIYRMEGDKIKEGTNTLADSTSDLVKHLLSTEGQKDFAALQVRVKAREND